MPSPFPGMDPYIESQGLWPGFHNELIGCARELLNQRLPADYVARTEERTCMIGPDRPDRVGIPDLAVVRRGSDREPSSRPAGVATLEPFTLPLALRDPVEIRETWIEIIALPSRSVVAIIELLSPTNKIGRGRSDYLATRSARIDSPAHLVEIDLVLQGRPLPLGQPLPPCDYYAMVSRAERRPMVEVYAWSIRRPLPTIPIPLRAPDRDVPLDLAELLTLNYERGRYGQLLDYQDPLAVPLAAEDQAWAEAIGRESRR